MSDTMLKLKGLRIEAVRFHYSDTTVHGDTETRHKLTVAEVDVTASFPPNGELIRFSVYLRDLDNIQADLSAWIDKFLEENG